MIFIYGRNIILLYFAKTKLFQSYGFEFTLFPPKLKRNISHRLIKANYMMYLLVVVCGEVTSIDNNDNNSSSIVHCTIINRSTIGIILDKR